MGTSKSKPIIPNNPLQELQLKEILRDQKLKKKEKEKKTLRKIQEKNIKKQQKHQKHQKINDHASAEPQPYFELNQQEYEIKIEQSLRHQLDNDLCGFILNQTSFTLQFFGNFEREISCAYEYIWKKKENELNQQFEEHSILMANALDAAVEKRVKYKPIHGPEKNQLQPLQPQTIYVVFENIDIARPNEANYDSLSPICKVDMETDFFKTTPCHESYALVLKDTKWKGYVRLKLRETQAERTPEMIVLQKPLLNDEGIYFLSESTISSSSRRREEFRYSNSSGYTSNPEYDYAYITHLNSHHPLSELTMTNINEKAKVDTKILPESCIANLHDFIEMPDEDDEEEEEEEGYEFDESSHFEERSLRKFNFPSVKYLNSKEFMRYFADLLRKKLAPKLGLKETDFESGTYRGASIHTQTYEIIPAIHVAHNAQNWPDCAFQFKRRERPTRTNPLTRKQFQWPTPEMIKRVETFGFHVIPMGHAPKRQRNPYREIEWKIIFPKAERFLETTLTNTQIKVFMIAKALVKAFVEQQEKDNTLMFTMDHLRMHLFWECEKNYVTWPEEFLGDVLVRFIMSFMQRLREKCLPDFFIQERNLFESIPEYSLVRLHSALAEIISNPVMHLVVALRNLYFVDDFIPRMDLKKIYNNLVENNYIKLKTFSRNSKNLSTLEDKRGDHMRLSKQVEESNGDAHGLIAFSQQKDKGKSHQLRRRTLMMKNSIEMRRRKELERNRKSIDSIDLEFIFMKNLKDSEKKKDYNQGVENLRRTNILEIILENLIAMGKTYTATKENRSIYLARIYLNQAKRLCKFYSNYGCDMGAIEYISQIETIESQIAILRNTESNIPPPALPIRTSLDPIKIVRIDSTDLKDLRGGNSYSRQNSRMKSVSPSMVDFDKRSSIIFEDSFESKIAVKADIHHNDSDRHYSDEEDQNGRERRRSIQFPEDAPSPTYIFNFEQDEGLNWSPVPSAKVNIKSSPIESKQRLKTFSKKIRKPRYTSSSSSDESEYDECSDCESSTTSLAFTKSRPGALPPKYNSTAQETSNQVYKTPTNSDSSSRKHDNSTQTSTETERPSKMKQKTSYPKQNQNEMVPSTLTETLSDKQMESTKMPLFIQNGGGSQTDLNPKQIQDGNNSSISSTIIRNENIKDGSEQGSIKIILNQNTVETATQTSLTILPNENVKNAQEAITPYIKHSPKTENLRTIRVKKVAPSPPRKLEHENGQIDQIQFSTKIETFNSKPSEAPNLNTKPVETNSSSIMQDSSKLDTANLEEIQINLSAKEVRYHENGIINNIKNLGNIKNSEIPNEKSTFKDISKPRKTEEQKKPITAKKEEFLNPKLNQVELTPHTPTTILRYDNHKLDILDTSYGFLNCRPSIVSRKSSGSSNLPKTLDEKRAYIKKMLQGKHQSLILVNGVKDSDISNL